MPGKKAPDFVRSASAPPRVFRPKSGFDPGITSTVASAPVGNEIPLHDVAERLVHAHAVLKDREADRLAEQWRRREAAVIDLRLIRVALNVVDVDALRRRIEEIGQVERSLLLDVLRREDLYVRWHFVLRRPESGNGGGADDVHLRCFEHAALLGDGCGRGCEGLPQWRQRRSRGRNGNGRGPIFFSQGGHLVDCPYFCCATLRAFRLLDFRRYKLDAPESSRCARLRTREKFPTVPRVGLENKLPAARQSTAAPPALPDGKDGAYQQQNQDGDRQGRHQHF